MTCHTWPRSCVSPRLRPTPHQKTRWRPSPESWESANLVLLILDGCLLAIVDAPNRWLQRSGHLPTSEANGWEDRKSTRLNSSHVSISYAVFCLKKKKQNTIENCHSNIPKSYAKLI